MKTATFCIAVTFSFIQFAFSAEGLRSLPDTAEAMGMIGGRFANLDDPSVTRVNPATLSELDGTHFQFSFQAWHGKTDFTQQATGAMDSMIVPWKYTGSLYLTHQLREGVTAGLGISAPFGVSINWPRNGLFRYSLPFDAVLQTAAINPAIGFELTEKVSLGLGLDIYYSRLKLEQAFPWALATGIPSQDGIMTFEGTGWGVGAYLGINVDLDENQRVAITGRLPVSVSYSGDFDVTNVPPPVAGVFSNRSDFGSEIEHPGSIGIGYGVDLSERLSLGLDFEWIQNSTHDDLPLNIANNQALLGGTNALPLQWKDSISAGFGIEYDLRDDLELRFGYLFSESPMKAQTYSPAVPANDRHILSAGFGYQKGPHKIDLGYSYLIMEDSHIQGNVNPVFNGTYEYDWNILTVSYTRKF